MKNEEKLRGHRNTHMGTLRYRIIGSMSKDAEFNACNNGEYNNK